MSQFKAVGAIILILWMFCIGANCTPVINSSNPGQFIKLDYETLTNFNVTANETIVSWEWYVNGVDQDMDANNLFVELDEPGQNNITVIGTNANGGAVYTFWPYVHREITTDDTETIDNTGYNELMSAVSDYDFNAGMAAIATPGISMLGGFYYLFILGMPFYMIWNRQRSLLIPSLLGLIMGWLILPFMPESYVMFLQLCILLGAAAVVWSLYKDR